MDQAYHCFCNAISNAAKKCIPRGRRNNRIRCWDAECKNLYQTFLQYPEGHESSRAATALLARLDRKRRDQWSEAVQNIDFSQSSREAWSTSNDLTGRSRQYLRQCPVSAYAITSQLVKAENSRVQIEKFFYPFCRNFLSKDLLNESRRKVELYMWITFTQAINL